MNFMKLKLVVFLFFLVSIKSRGFASSSREVKRESTRYLRLIAIARCLAKCYENEILPRSEKRTKLIAPVSCITSKCKTCIKLTKKLDSKGISNIICPTEWKEIENSPQDSETNENKNEILESLSSKSMNDEYELLGEDELKLEVSIFCSSTLYNSTVYFSWNFLNMDFHRVQFLIPRDEFPLLFVVETETDGVWESMFLIEHWFFGVEVEVGREYRIRVTGVGSAGPIPLVTSQVLKGFPIEGRILAPPQNIQLLELSINESETRGLISWESGSGMNASCSSKVYLLGEDMRAIERTTIDKAFWIEFTGLEFNGKYQIIIIESFFGAENQIGYNFTFPDCLDKQLASSIEQCTSLKTELKNIEIVNESANSFVVKWNSSYLLGRSIAKHNEVLCFEVSIVQEENNLNIVSGNYLLSSYKAKVPPTREIYLNCCYPINVGSLTVKKDRVKADAKIHITFTLNHRYQKMLDLRINEPARKTFLPWDFEKERKLVLLGWSFVSFLPGIPIAFFLYFLGWKIKERCIRHKQRQEYFQNLDRQCELQTSLTVTTQLQPI